jgi:hypothetical protein
MGRQLQGRCQGQVGCNICKKQGEEMICPIVISTLRGQGLAVLLESIKQYAPECPVYLRGPESVIENFDADYKI